MVERVDRRRVFEEYAYVLDFLPQGYPHDRRPLFKRDPICQAVGERYFSLLELVMVKGVEVKVCERLFVGRGFRLKVRYVNRKLSYDELTAAAKAELPRVISAIVDANPERFVRFFNEARPVTNRLHQLELLPGVGKKTMWKILEEREKAPFRDFEDLAKRVGLKKAKEIVEKRIELELQCGERNYLFVLPHCKKPGQYIYYDY